MPKRTMSVLLLLLSPALLWAEESPKDTSFAEALVTDRPDAAEASITVGKHRFQVETSFAFSRDTDTGTTTKTVSFPTLLRFGVWEPFEIRMEGEMYTFQTETGATVERGLSDLAFGVKFHAMDNR